ncbi:MAG: hypothetical protein RIT04_391 [Candidatus Parcubacteria bacterium]
MLEYTQRLEHYMPISWVYVGGSTIEEESRAMLKQIPDAAYVVVLDDKGKEFSSEGLAEFIGKRQLESHKDIFFIIGGAFGVGEEVKARAQYVWSLSKLTFPHELVREILAESLYRACTILRGEKYHHA